VVKSILIPIGPYTDAEPLLQVVDLVKNVWEAEITLLGIITMPVVTSINEEEVKDLKQYQELDDHLSYVEKLFSDIGLRNVYRKIIVSRDVPSAIIEEVATGGYDLLVLAKRRKPPLVVRRSVSKSVIPKVSIPVLVLTMD